MISALMDHVWQSTLFAAGAALLARVLRDNQAKIRHWVWLSASLKFFVPFSLLVALRGNLNWRSSPVLARPRLALIIEEVGRPFLFSTVTSPGVATTETSYDPMSLGRRRLGVRGSRGLVSVVAAMVQTQNRPTFFAAIATGVSCSR